MKKLQLYVCLLLFATGYTGFAQNPFTEMLSSPTTQGIIDADISTRDIVHADDVIINGGSLCVGFDCVDGESFGFDTERFKENNLRIHFDDTSASASFPNNDWRITINDSANGGANYFGIDDATAGTRPFRIDAGAPSNSLYVDDGGRVGFGTPTPVVELHSRDGDTPTLRLEQDGSSGFTPQTWDIAGNENNFFIRDATNGSRLVFRIRSGAPTNAIHIAANGAIGIGGVPNANTSLELFATDKGLQLNRLTTVERTALGVALTATEVGVLVYDTDDNATYIWTGIAWVATSTDDQNISGSGFAANMLTVGIESGTSQIIDLSSLDNSGTDDQNLTLTATGLALEDGGTVSLLAYLDNTDDQNISGSGLAGNTLTIGIESGASQAVDLSSLNDSGTDDQDISGSGLAGTVLTIGIESGASETVDLASLQDGSGTDDQDLTAASLTGTVLRVEIENGAFAEVDLAAILAPLEAENAAQQAQIDDLIARMEVQEDCACDPTLNLNDYNLQPDRAYLFQNIPNPFDNTTMIGYFVPFSYSKANIVVSSMTGQILNNIPLSKFGEGTININKARMQSATYLYTLYVDGKRVDTKRMIVE